MLNRKDDEEINNDLSREREEDIFNENLFEFSNSSSMDENELSGKKKIKLSQEEDETNNNLLDIKNHSKNLSEEVFLEEEMHEKENPNKEDFLKNDLTENLSIFFFKKKNYSF